MDEGEQGWSHPYDFSNSSSPSWKQAGTPSSGVFNPDSKTYQKYRQADSVFQLHDVAEGLMTKLYRFRQILDNPDMGSNQFSESFWKSGIFPELPKLCMHIAKRFPEHTVKLQLDKIDKQALDQLHDKAELHLSAMEPWMMVLLELMRFREQALRVILDLSSTVITLLPNQNPLILHALMNLFCSFVRVNLLSDKVPRKMLLQTYNLTHNMLKGGRDYELYHRLVQFIDSYDPPLKGLHEDLNFISPRIGEVLEGVAPIVFLGADYQKLRCEGFLSPFHPRYPDKLTNSAHPARAQDLANVGSYRDWVLLGYLACPSELLRGNGSEIAMAVLSDTLVFPLFRDEFMLLHEEYQLYVLPKIDESKRTAKGGRLKQKDADQEYSLAKKVKKMICDVHDLAVSRAESMHREYRTFLRQELNRMALFFSDQPSLIAPNIQMILAAVSMACTEVVWYFTHVGIVSGKSKGGRVVPVDIEANDPTIGFLLHGMDRLRGLIQKYISAVKSYALGYLGGAAERLRFLLATPGMLSLDLDSQIQEVLASLSECLNNLPKLHSEKGINDDINLSGFRKDWISFLMLVSSSRASINVRHLEKATMSTGRESIISEGNMAYLWSRSVDDIEGQLSQHASLKTLYFYRQHLTTVFRQTMFGPEGRPQHCCAWLGVASSFPANTNASTPDEQSKIAQDAISYVESVLESIMSGFEGLVNILDSEGGFGSLEYKLLPDQAASRMNQATRNGNPSSKSLKSNIDLPLPGSESEPVNRESVRMLEAAVQRLTNLCTALNDMEPIYILGHVFIPLEYLRDHIVNNFKRRLLSILSPDGQLQRPSVIEALILRHMHIVHMIEKHISLDLKEGLREILLAEAFAGPIQDLQGSETNENTGGTATSTICNWYMDNVVKDVNGAGVVFTPSDKTFRAVRPLGGSLTEVVADISELKAFVRVFGPYGVGKLDNLLHEHISVLLGRIDKLLHSNKDALETLALNMHNSYERESALKQVIEIEPLMAFSIQVGHTLSFRSLLTEAAAEVLESNIPILFTLLSDYVKNAPPSIPERQEILSLKMLAGRLGAIAQQDATVVHSVLKIIGAGNSVWVLLPYLYVCCMVSHVWNSSSYSIHTGGFNNNVHCLARCINALMTASEFVRSERKELQRQQQLDREGFEMSKLESEALSLEGQAAVEASIKSMMKTFVQCSAAIILDRWNESNRSPLVAKLIFLDQLCEISQCLPKSTLEMHVPYTILRSIYQLYYENTVPTLVLTSPARRHTSVSGSSHIPLRSGSFTINAGSESNGGHGAAFTSLSKSSIQRRRRGTDMESSYDKSSDLKANGGRGVRLSGPLDYSRKVSFVEGAVSGSAPSVSPLQRFVMSRSGPVTYKSAE